MQPKPNREVNACSLHLKSDAQPQPNVPTYLGSMHMNIFVVFDILDVQKHVWNDSCQNHCTGMNVFLIH